MCKFDRTRGLAYWTTTSFFFWAEHQKGYTQSFAPKRELEVDTLYQLFQKIRDASLEIPSELGKDMLDIPMPVAVTWGDATSSVEHREAVLKMLVDLREQTVKCHAPGDAEKIDELFKASGVCTKAWQSSAAYTQPAVGLGTMPKQLGLQMMSYDLFPGCPADVFGGTGDPKKLPEYTRKNGAQWEAALEWLILNKGFMTAQAVWDGRSKNARMASGAWLERSTGTDSTTQVDFWATYSLADHLTDIRLPNRQVFAAALNKETCQIGLPLPRVRFASKERNSYTGSGETSTYTTSYSGIPLRHIRELPRLLPENRKEVTGCIKSPVWSEEGVAEFSARGEPLFMAESKSIDLFVNFFRDMEAKSVFDLTGGTGAAAIAAMLLGIKYDCLCMSIAHKKWLDQILNKVVIALVHGADKDNTSFDAKLVDSTRVYFAALAEEGERFMRKYKEGEDGPEVEEPATGSEAVLVE